MLRMSQPGPEPTSPRRTDTRITGSAGSSRVCLRRPPSVVDPAFGVRYRHGHGQRVGTARAKHGHERGEADPDATGPLDQGEPLPDAEQFVGRLRSPENG